MPAYDIDPAGVQGVLGRTEGVAAGFDAHTTAIGGGVDSGAGGSGSGVVSGALGDFATAAGETMTAVFTRVGSCLTGAANATNAYVAGDLEMAANAQSSAGAAPEPRASMPGGG